MSTSFSKFASALTTGDLNDDSEFGDVAMAIPATDEVAVVRLVGGGLQAPAFYPTGDNPKAIAHGELNGDSLTDLVTANVGDFASGNISVLFSNGTGYDAPLNLTMGSVPVAVAFGHFNADAHPDLVAADGNNSRVVVRLSNGDGTFGPEIPLSISSFPQGVVVGDFNPDVDDQDDIAAGKEILFGNGDGTFSAATAIATGFSASTVHAFDIDADGKMDLVLGSATNKLMSVLCSNGDGTFQPAEHYPLTATPGVIAFTDITEDGLPDLIATNGGDASTLAAGRGGGRFIGVRAFPAVSNISSRTGGYGAAVADFTGDDIPDVVVANRGSSTGGGGLSGTACALLGGNGDGTLSPLTSIAGLPGSAAVAGDWDSDTAADLALVATGPSAPQLLIAMGNGDGTFDPYTSTNLPGVDPSAAHHAVIVAALVNSSDSFPDLLVCNYGNGDVSVFLGDGNGNFSAQSTVPAGTQVGGIATGDFNEDGVLDIVVSYEGDDFGLNGGAVIALGNGDGTFGAPQALRSSVSAYGVVVADFNGDDDLDVAVAMERTTFNWDVEISAGNGDGTFQAPVPAGITETLVRGIATADGDMDGKPDLLVPLAGDSVLLLRGLGDGTFASVYQAATGGGGVFAADLTGDGFPDLVAPTGEGYVSVFANSLGGGAIPLPPLRIALDSPGGRVVLSWPGFYRDYVLKESGDLITPFEETARMVSDENGLFKVEVDSSEKTGFFILEELEAP